MDSQEPLENEEITFTEETELDEETKRILAKIPKTELKKLMKPYKPPLTEKQQERNNKLVALNKAKWEKLKQDRLKYEEDQLKILSKQVKIKPKRAYTKKPIIYLSDSDDEDEQGIEEFLKYKKWKENHKKVVKKPEKTQDEDVDDDDEYIQKTKPKIQKATELLNSVNKLDNALKSLSISNPYLEAMNRKR